MRSIVLGVLVLVACTKPNPNVCCTDEADCSAKGIPLGSQCDDGLLCRGNQCIAQPCASSAACDSSAPYCVAESCAEACSEDAQCPGFSQATEQRYCETGTCVECRTGMNADCTSAKPFCDNGSCRTCRAHEECASGVCQSNGTCAEPSAIAYVDTSGSPSAECTQASPCSTINRALVVTPVRPFVVINSGTYSGTSTLTFQTRSLIGRGSTQPVITRSTPGPIFSFGISTDVAFENLQVSGATTSGTDYGIAIECDAHGGSATIKMRRMTISQNDTGISLPACAFELRESIIKDNAGGSLFTQDMPGTIDRCIVSGNGAGLGLDGGVYTVTNNFITRNRGNGIEIFSTSPSNRIEFNTIADNQNPAPNTNAYGISCGIQGTTGSFPNNVIVRNKQQVFGANCTYPSSIISDANISNVAFKSADVAPYDYHLTAGSVAIDAATISTLSYDFDGQARPSGNGRDVGADEYVP